eukprot:scaffold18138_cov128-Cylindrotheca_fusiformis.AAC.16
MVETRFRQPVPIAGERIVSFPKYLVSESLLLGMQTVQSIGSCRSTTSHPSAIHGLSVSCGGLFSIP